MSHRENSNGSYYRYSGQAAHNQDPTNAGWTYQGANNQSRVEYYQRGDVKMDYYPTTGTVKTSMNHPTQGPTQMFRKNVSEGEFQKILENPRTHTGKGYQRTNK